MPALQYPLINGHAYSFSSVEIKVDDFLCVGVSSMNYNEAVEPVSVYGSDPVRVGRTLGKRKLTADLEIYRREWNVLLPQLGRNFGRKKVHITVQYSEDHQPVITDTVEGWFQETEAANQEGTDASRVKLTLDPFEIRWGASGVDNMALEEIPTASNASFWIQTEDGIEGPDYSDNLWDSIRIGGILLPGICSVKGLPTLAFDKKKAGGVDGATITVNGYLPGPVDIECKMWTPSQWRLFESYVAPKIWRIPNKGKTDPATLAKDVDHPALAVWGIRQVVILGVSVLEPAGEPGVRVVKIKCLQHVAAEKKTKTATAKGSTNVPLAPQLNPARNQAGAPPEKTDIHPGGPAQTRKGGVS